MRRFLVLSFILAVTAWMAAPAAAQPAPQMINVTGGQDTFKGKGCDEQFPKEVKIEAAGQEFDLVAVGSGVRKKMVFKVYEGIAYADQAADLSGDPYQALIEGDFPKRIVMYMLRNVDGGKMRGAYEEGLKKTKPEAERSDSFKAAMDAFLAYFPDDSEVMDGQTIELTWIPGMGLYTMMGGVPSPPIDNVELATALWGIWFGADPVSGDLKKDMVRFVAGEE